MRRPLANIRAAALALALVLALVSAASASAFTRARSDLGAWLTWSRATSAIPVTTTLTGAERDAVQRALATWSATSCVALTLLPAGAPAPVAGAIAIVRGPLAATGATFAAHTEPHVVDARHGVVDGAVITVDDARVFSTAPHTPAGA
ncbi:MAG TPA: hypothetical protein VGO62_06055, partial [Myxococcota bacterium]